MHGKLMQFGGIFLNSVIADDSIFLQTSFHTDKRQTIGAISILPSPTILRRFHRNTGLGVYNEYTNIR